MYYRCRASPKHCYNIIEENYGGGGHRTRLRDKGVEEGADQGGWRALGGSPTPTGSRTPPFPIRRGRGKEEVGGKKERGGDPLPNSDWSWGGGRPLLCSFSLLSTKAHVRPIFPRGGSGNPLAFRYSPKSPGTLPMSEYSRPIYQSLVSSI